MKYVYITLCALIIMELLRRKFDFLTVCAASFMLYTSNCLIGRVWIPQSGVNAYDALIHTETYVLICAQLLIILLFFYAKRKNVKLVNRRFYNSFSDIDNFTNIRNYTYRGLIKNTEIYWVLILLASFSVVLYNLFFKIDIDVFFSYTSKTEILNETSFVFGISIWVGMICFFYYYFNKRMMGIVISLFIILVSFVLGSRAYFATILVGVLVAISLGINSKLKKTHLNDSKSNRGINKKIIFLGLLFFIFLIMYKLVYKEIRAGDFWGALDVLTRTDTWSSFLDIDELRIVCADYNYVIEKNISLPINDVLARLVSIIPFANHTIPLEYPIRFSTFLQQDINTTYGLASNFWGECFAMGGAPFVMFMTFIWLFFINKMNEHVLCNRTPFIFTMSSYLCFYIHRLDWTQVMGCIKTILLFFLIKILFDVILNKQKIHVYYCK